MATKCRTTFFVAAFCTLGLAWLFPVHAEERDWKLMQELCRLQLFDLAEAYGAAQLTKQGISVQDQATGCIEQIRTVAAHAQAADEAQRDLLWKRARQLAQTFATDYADHPMELLVQVQDALTVQAQGEQQRRLASAAGNTTGLTQASETLRQAEGLFDEVAERIEKLLPKRRVQAATGAELTLEELNRLKVQVDYQRARTEGLRAFCYEPESRDRKALLLAALDIVETAAARLNPQDELAGKLRVQQMSCLRELGRFADVQRIWNLVEQEKLSLEVQTLAFSEYLRAQAATGDPQAAWQLCNDVRYAEIIRSHKVELELARLEIMVRLAQQATTLKLESEKSEWQQQAMRQAMHIETMHGHYWGRCADELLASLSQRGAAATTGDMELLTRQADVLYLRGKAPEAQALYDQAAHVAQSAKNIEGAFSLRYKAALIAQERKEFAVAATRLERLAIDYKLHPSAPDVHLAACWNQAQQVRTSPNASDAYVALLQEHAERWPASPTADQANCWLGNWRQARGEFALAFDAYALVRREAKVFPEAVAGAIASSEQELAQLQQAGRASEPRARQQLDYFQSLLPNPQNKLSWGKTEIAVALAASKLLVQAIPGGCSTAETILSTATDQASDASSEWRQEAESLLIVALAGQSNKAASALERLRNSKLSDDQLLPLLNNLSRIATRLRADQQTTLAQVQLQVIEQLQTQTKQLTASQQTELKRLRAATLAQAGDRTKALEAYAALVEAETQNGELQEAYATLLARGTDNTSLTQSLARWRTIAAKSPPREDRWYRAKYAVADLQLRLGEHQSALTLVRYLLETPPGIPDEAWKRRFETLRSTLETK
jgi:hypothetical protein